MSFKLYITEFFSPSNDYFSNISTVNDNIFHMHEFYEIFYMIDGSAIQTLDNKKNTLTPGSVFIIRPFEQHKFDSINNEPILYRNIGIKPEEFKRVCDFLSPNLFETINEKSFNPSNVLPFDLIDYFEKNIPAEDIQNSKIFNANLRIVFMTILTKLFLNNKSSLSNHWSTSLIQIMQQPHAFKVSVSELISNIPYSKPHVCSEFKKRTGKTITEMFTDFKLQHAYYLLKTTSDSVTHIAEVTGFSSLSFFNRSFKKKYNISPKDCRKSKLV